MEERKKPARRELCTALSRLGVNNAENAAIEPFLAEEDGREYEVWRIKTAEGEFVLKREKEREAEFYKTFFPEKKPYAPAFLGETEFGGERYFLLEYIEGETMTRCTREKLEKVLIALETMQDEFWEREEYYDKVVTLEESVASVMSRSDWLGSEKLELALSRFREIYIGTERTLCHDDLLPFNVLVGERAVLFDWEYGGMQPYASSFARLIAHCRDEENAFFYMKKADREFAIEHYYENLVKKHGVSRISFGLTLDWFLFYEYTEWVMLGNRYGGGDDPRCVRSLKLAEALADKLLG